MLDYWEGLLKITNVVLSITAGYVAVTLVKASYKRKELAAWKPLIIALIFFMVQEILGALRAFSIFSSPFLTHIVPTIILGLVMYALARQIHINIVEK